MDLENRFFYRFIIVFRAAILLLATIASISFIFWNLTPDYFQNSKIGYYIISATTTYKVKEANGIKLYPLPDLSPDVSDLNYMNKINVDSHCSMTSSEKKKAGALRLHVELEVIITAIIGFASFYFLLNLFFSGLLYLVSGKKLSWRWIIFFIKIKKT